MLDLLECHDLAAVAVLLSQMKNPMQAKITRCISKHMPSVIFTFLFLMKTCPSQLGYTSTNESVSADDCQIFHRLILLVGHGENFGLH